MTIKLTPARARTAAQQRAYIARCKQCDETSARVAKMFTQYADALADARSMLYNSGIEITSALKQAGSDNGIEYGDDMGAFVTWARQQLGVSA